ncbi:glycosyltransferase [Leptobacterium flavescens]|uniref:Glycosyltransferase n=1 Tax=Leptobacterium flavescens TaxID=472055 RepID=A0A6P0ULV2_9FLAO|nr:glycosyltransferase [Leptobacterium flavescens]NER13987.1 glycosyltransferase [Leptobacterium flavescens]
MLLSIVIPMYNAEKYIACCLDSVLSQDLPSEDYEIIVANDGSRDKSPEIVENYIKEHSNIILHNQSNQGNGAARNAGAALARGKYLYFLDSDDYIAANVLGGLTEILEKEQLDILGFKSEVTSSSDLKQSANFHERTEDLHVLDGVSFVSDTNYRAEVWWYITRREHMLKTGLSFYDRKFVQDSYYTPTLFLDAKKVAMIPADIHRYRQTADSITHKRSPEHIKRHMLDLSYAVEKLSGLIARLSHNGAVKRLRNRQHGYAFFFLVRFPKSDMGFGELRKTLKKFRSMGAYPITEFVGKDYQGLRYKILVFIFNRSYLLFPFLFIYKTFYRLLK